MAELLRRHVGVGVSWYFEEDMHTAEHVQVHDARDAWAAALGHAGMGGGAYSQAVHVRCSAAWALSLARI